MDVIELFLCLQCHVVCAVFDFINYRNGQAQAALGWSGQTATEASGESEHILVGELPLVCAHPGTLLHKQQHSLHKLL